MALRRSAQRYQFVCPSLWGDQFTAPLAGLADGTIVLGASRGLMLLREDGSLAAHPDPAAVGRSSDVVRSVHGVFALRATLEGSEVIAIDAEKVRVLWKDSKSLYSLAALDDKLVLLRTGGGMLEQVTIAAADGRELDRQVAPLDAPVDYVFARAAAGAAYALVVFRTGTALGNLRMNAFTKLAEGELSVAGPLSIGDSTLLALDGKLSQLVEGHATPLVDEHNVQCLDQHDGLTYACNPDGIARVTGKALAEPLFRFTWLTAPDLGLVAEGEARSRCNAQWQDLRFDLLATGISLLEDGALDAGGALPDGSVVDGSVVDGGAAVELPDAERESGASDAHAAAADGAQGAPGREAGGPSCALLPAKPGPGGSGVYVTQLALALAFASRRRRGRT